MSPLFCTLKTWAVFPLLVTYVNFSLALSTLGEVDCCSFFDSSAFLGSSTFFGLDSFEETWTLFIGLASPASSFFFSLFGFFLSPSFYFSSFFLSFFFSLSFFLSPFLFFPYFSFFSSSSYLTERAPCNISSDCCLKSSLAS